MTVKLKYLAIGAVVLLLAGFLLGRMLTTKDVDVDYVELPPIPIDPPDIPEPEETVPENPTLPPELTKPSVVYVERVANDGYKELYVELQSRYNQLQLEHREAEHRITAVVDSLAVYKDHITIRRYTNWELYNVDTVGKFIASFDVQFNRIQKVYDTRLYPVQKTVTVTQYPSFSFFAMAGADTKLKNFDITGGVILKKLMLGAGLDYNTEDSKSTFKVKAGVTF